MNLGEAIAIFMEIDRDDKTIEEKGTAIYEVLNMATRNGITKKQMLAVIKWLLNLYFDVPEEGGVK